jgi:hypothetical protein
MIKRGEMNTRLALTTLTLCLLAMASSGQAKLAAAPEATPNSVDLSWTAPGDDGSTGTATQYDIRYSTSSLSEASWDAATQVAGEPTPSVAGTTENFEVTGLQPNTTYYFAIKTADEVPNWSGISNVVTKSTEPEADPPVAVADLSVDASGSTTLTLGWTAPGDDGGSGTAAQYDIRYSTAPINAGNWGSATQATGEPSPQLAGSAESFVVTGLSASTTYYFALMTADEVPNWSGLSNVASGATSTEVIPPTAIANLGAGSPTEHSIALSWTAPGDDGMAGTASQYDIRYSMAYITEANFYSASQVASPPTPLPGGSFQSTTVTGLNSGTTYFFAIKTADEVPNWSAVSNVSTLATSNDVTQPNTVNSLNAVLPTLSSLTLVWLAPGDDGTDGTADSYDIRYSTAPITEANWSAATRVSNEPNPQPAGTPESLMVAGLAEGTTYYFGLKASDERGNESALSNVASNSTTLDSTPPSAIGDLVAVPGSNEGEIDLSWSAPGDDGDLGFATAYEIRYSDHNINGGNWSSALPWADAPIPGAPGSPQSCTIVSLVPGETYYIGVKTYDDAANPSALSNVAYTNAYIEFILANGNLAQPTSPPPLAVLPTAQPVLTVENADAAPDNVYRFELATDSNFFGLVAGGVVNQEVDVPLHADQDYFWRVATNADGYSETYSFSVEPVTHAYPNPLRMAEADAATFTDLPAGSDLLLTSISGSVVRQWSNLDGADVSWDGTNESGKQVASGTYLWYLPDTGAKGKLIVIN